MTNPDGRLEAQPGRDRERERRLGQGHVGEPAEHRERHHAIPGAEPRARGRRADASRDLDPRDERAGRLHLVLAAGEQEIGKAHPGGGDLDDHAVAVLRLVDVDQT